MTFPVGKTVKEVRWMTEEELKAEGWERNSNPCAVLVFDDGSKIYASQDGGGNGPGCMFGKTAAGESVYIEPPPPPKEEEN